MSKRPLRPGQLRVHVTAVGLNFRDVLNVLGMYPGDPGAPGVSLPQTHNCEVLPGLPPPSRLVVLPSLNLIVRQLANMKLSCPDRL